MWVNVLVISGLTDFKRKGEAGGALSCLMGRLAGVMLTLPLSLNKKVNPAVVLYLTRCA